MRLVLIPAALAATAALTVPAHAAASPPACAVALVADAVGTAAECTTSLPGASYRAYRWLRVEVAAGTVEATLSCAGYGSRGAVVTDSAVLSISASTGARCVARLAAVTSGPKATGVSGLTPDLIDEAGS